MEDDRHQSKKSRLLLFGLLIAVILGERCWHKRCTAVPEAEEKSNGTIVEQSIKTIVSEEESTEQGNQLPYWSEKSESLLSVKEQEELKRNVMFMAEQVKENYRDVQLTDASDSSFGISEFSLEQRKRVVKELSQKGLVSVTEGANMENYEAVEKFYGDYLNSQDSIVTIYDVHIDGIIGTVTFIYRNNKLQTYYAGVQWKEGGIPEMQETSVNDVAEMKLTKKGYFIYTYKAPMAHASMRLYWRVKPLSEECRKLTQKYISGLSYVNYNMLVTNWDSSNVEDILMPCMFEDIYRIHTGKFLKSENWLIPAKLYERIMTTYFPVSVEQLRKHCEYSESTNSYKQELIYASAFPPFGEVVDYKENANGTITLIVDGVWTDYNSDYAFVNQIVVQPFDDGTFRYLSNSIEKKELKVPTIETMKG